jgi:hypothetical protein
MKLKTANIMQVQIQVPENPKAHQAQQPNLPINDGLQIQAAEFWLKLGEADQAWRELEKLPTTIWRCRWALKTRIAAMGVLRERREVAV